MTLLTQKRLAAGVLKVGETRVRFDPGRLSEIEEAITKNDIRRLVGLGAVYRVPAKGVSRSRARKIMIQKRKGRRAGPGSRKGSSTARKPRKKQWIETIRAQRKYLKKFRAASLITKQIYRDLYRKSKGGYFRSARHIRLYMEEHNLIQNVKKKS